MIQGTSSQTQIGSDFLEPVSIVTYETNLIVKSKLTGRRLNIKFDKVTVTDVAIDGSKKYIFIRPDLNDLENRNMFRGIENLETFIHEKVLGKARTVFKHSISNDSFKVKVNHSSYYPGMEIHNPLLELVNVYKFPRGNMIFAGCIWALRRS